MSRQNGIDIEVDKATRGYYGIWEPIGIGAVKTRHEALDDLKQAAYFGVDRSIDLKLKVINMEKED